MGPNPLLISFLGDVVRKLRWRFFALTALSAICAATDGLRLFAAFLLLPFIGLSLDQTGGNLFATARTVIEAAGFDYALAPVAVIVMLVFLAQATLTLLQSWYQAGYMNWYTLIWRQHLFQALGRARWQYFLDANRGELLNALSQETARLSAVVGKFLFALSNILVAIAYLAFSLTISVQATLLMAVIGLSIVAFNLLFAKRLLRYARAIVEGSSQMTGIAQEFLNNIKAIKASPRGFSVDVIAYRPLRTIFSSERTAFMLPSSSRIASEVFVMLALIAGISGMSVWGGGESPPGFLLVLILFMRSYSKLSTAIIAAQQMYAMLPAYEVVEKIYRQAAGAEEARWQSGPAFERSRLSSGVAFENITVHHGDKVALDSVSATLPFGSVIALVGASGAGKTTFVDALLGLVSPTAGRIAVGGEDVARYNIQSWRSCFGYVSQELTLINGSLADNIRLFNPEASDEDVRRAAILAHADEFIADLADGYATQVGEMGLKLSGGQRQRIAVARALINDPPILIFDEATSALDSESEEKVMQAVYEMRKGRIIILIAHRLSTVRHADNILVLEQGRIVEQGKWEALIQTGGRFDALWQRLAGHMDAQHNEATLTREL